MLTPFSGPQLLSNLGNHCRTMIIAANHRRGHSKREKSVFRPDSLNDAISTLLFKSSHRVVLEPAIWNPQAYRDVEWFSSVQRPVFLKPITSRLISEKTSGTQQEPEDARAFPCLNNATGSMNALLTCNDVSLQLVRLSCLCKSQSLSANWALSQWENETALYGACIMTDLFGVSSWRSTFKDSVLLTNSGP